MDFTRVSSVFNPARLHPILNTIRGHMGTDYAAPTGTPVHAAGDGRVSFEGTRGGYGNAIVLDHSNSVSTLYGHMSRFATNVHLGSHVSQGDIIGFVGMTGLATGPHLHYEYLMNGVHMNPQTVKLAGAEPLGAESMDKFRAATATFAHQPVGSGGASATGDRGHGLRAQLGRAFAERSGKLGPPRCDFEGRPMGLYLGFDVGNQHGRHRRLAGRFRCKTPAHRGEQRNPLRSTAQKHASLHCWSPRTVWRSMNSGKSTWPWRRLSPAPPPVCWRRQASVPAQSPPSAAMDRRCAIGRTYPYPSPGK